MIDKIHIKNFKSYADAELKLAPLTVLIGANASGKSNALEALRFLQLIGSGKKIETIQYEIDQNEYLIRGNSQSLFKFGQREVALNCFFGGENESNLLTVFSLGSEQKLVLMSEALRSKNRVFYVANKLTDKFDYSIKFGGHTSKEDKGLIVTDVTIPFFHTLGSSYKSQNTNDSNKITEQLSTYFDGITRHLNHITFLDPKPRSMRAYTYLTKNSLRDDGENLSAVLYYLWNEGTEEDKATLLSFISSLPEQDITGFDFLRGPRNEVMLQVIETFGGKERKVDAALLSDGTLRILAFAVSLLTAPKGSLVIIEEIDNGLHPSRADKLLETLRNVATKRGLSVLLSSHNPALLDALPDAAVPDVVFCYRNPETGDSELVKMADLDNYPELILQGSLGDLLTEGLIDRFVKNQKSKAERVEQGKAWLESVK